MVSLATVGREKKNPGREFQKKKIPVENSKNKNHGREFTKKKIPVENSQKKLTVEISCIVVEHLYNAATLHVNIKASKKFKMSGLNDDLIAFFSSLKTYVNLTTRAGLQEDPNMREHLCFKLEDYLQVVRTLTSIVNSKAGHEELKSLLGRLVWELQELVNELQSQVRQDTQHNNFRLNKQCDTGGRPKYVVTKEQIETLRDTGMNWKSVAQVLGISERTLFRRREEFNMEDTFSNISDTDLKNTIYCILQQTPYVGETYVRGGLVARKIFVPRHRVRECLRSLDPVGRAMRRRFTIQRRLYNVAAPNHLWHIDSNHKLIQWKFVVHGCIDGNSRTIIYLKCRTNNLAATALEFFIEGTEKFGIPLRVRTDCGVENVDIARFMITTRGTGRGSFITGTSVHNQRIERLWREVNRVLGALYKDLFIFMENNNVLDVDNEIHLLALEIVYLPRINASLNEFEQQWNYHGVRTVGHQSPMALWYSRNIQNQQDVAINDLSSYGVEYNGEVPDVETENNVVVPECTIVMSDEQWSIINRVIPDPLVDDGNYGINLYCRVLETLEQIL